MYWRCSVCTFLNPSPSSSTSSSENPTCRVCLLVQPPCATVSPPPEICGPASPVDDDELSAAGNVFVLKGFDGFGENEPLESEGFGQFVGNGNGIKIVDCKGFGALRPCSSGQNKRRVLERSIEGNSEGFDGWGLKRKYMDSGVSKELKVDAKDVGTKAGNKGLKITSFKDASYR